LAALFESGRIIDLILGLMLLEALALLAWRRTRGSGVPVTGVLTNLAAGACLLLALRAALRGEGWQIVGVWLGVGLAAHVADILGRWQQARL
jgi:hypothetical protein